MNKLFIDQYEIKTSRTEQKVPVVNSVHLHSIYNPYKEAEALLDKYTEAISNNSEVLVLGLGFAYHVNELVERMTKTHGENFRIVVIEPNMSVYNDCLDLNLLNKKNILVYAGYSPRELYADGDLVHFLLKKPIVIAHPPSFNLCQIYFKDFLSFEAPTKIGESMDFVSHASVRKYLESFDQDKTFKEILKTSIAEQSKFQSMDFLAMALYEMTKGTQGMNQKEKSGDL